MYRQSVRRRRAVVGLLVVFSLALLTAYFGESAGGALHGVQRGMLEVLSPIQEGANRALKPVRDLAGWVGDTFNAKEERDRLQRERDVLRRRAIGAEQARRENAQLRALVNLDRAPELNGYRPVTARVIGRSPTLWYGTMNVNKGRGDGVRVNQPVISGDGLVGRVSAVTAGAAQVTLITDHTSGVSAKVTASGVAGLVKTAVGNPNDLLLDFVSRRTRLFRGQSVVTAGARSSDLESLFPPGIPIGSIARVDEGELELYQRVHIKPFADLRRLDFVQVLVSARDGGRGGVADLRAQAGTP